jgi:hypothetical protein
MKTCGGSPSLNLDTRWRWVVNFTPRLLYHRAKIPRYPLDRRLAGPQSRSRSWKVQKNLLALPELGTSHPVRNPSLYRLSYPVSSDLVSDIKWRIWGSGLWNVIRMDQRKWLKSSSECRRKVQRPGLRLPEDVAMVCSIRKWRGGEIPEESITREGGKYSVRTAGPTTEKRNNEVF